MTNSNPSKPLEVLWQIAASVQNPYNPYVFCKDTIEHHVCSFGKTPQVFLDLIPFSTEFRVFNQLLKDMFQFVQVLDGLIQSIFLIGIVEYVFQVFIGRKCKLKMAYSI